ncbi:hypothetical protein AURDEDRAFT_173909 [Auricularia subglabra TFB-10046 SS5]|nr:hypothetical protein AURDEDRAFT_173909 [Auricularia subglabra TFB-10046 SS5]
MSSPPALYRDVLLVIFDYLDYTALFNCSQASRLWRVTARCHLVFWKYLSLGDTPPTVGQIMLLSERLNVVSSRCATISLSLRCVTFSAVLQAVLVPTLETHIQRVEELVLIVSPACAEVFWPLFRFDAPRLRSLQVVVKGASRSTPRPVPAMFNVHKYTSLENIFLLDVPLPGDLPPITHVLRAFKIMFFQLASQFQRVLDWLPRSHIVDLWARDAALPHENFSPWGSPGSVDLSVLRYLVVYREALLASLSQCFIPFLDVRVWRPQPSTLEIIIPRNVALCVCIKSLSHPRISDPWATVTVATADRCLVRHFDYLAPEIIGSQVFLNSVFLSDNIVSLVCSLTLAFRRLCQFGYTFPRLQSLCLGMNGFADERWNGGSIACPVLGLLIFQREHSSEEAVISRFELDDFIGGAFSPPPSNALCVRLRDVQLQGFWGAAGVVASVVQQEGAAKWSAVEVEQYKSASVIPISIEMALSSARPRTDWIDKAKKTKRSATQKSDQASRSEIALRLGLENAFRGLAAAMAADEQHLSRRPNFSNLEAFMATLGKPPQASAPQELQLVDFPSPHQPIAAPSHSQDPAAPLLGDALLAHLGVTEGQVIRLTSMIVHNYPGGNAIAWNAASIALTVVAALAEDDVDLDAVRLITVHSEYSPYFDISGVLRFPSVVMLEAVLADGTVIPLVFEAAKSMEP